jgi:tetratricopeptide (TPR) repeat protein
MKRLNYILIVFLLFIALLGFCLVSVSGQNYTQTYSSTQNVVSTTGAQISPPAVEYTVKSGLISTGTAGLTKIYDPRGNLIGESSAFTRGSFDVIENKGRITLKNNAAENGKIEFGNFSADKTLQLSNLGDFAEITYLPGENAVILNNKSVGDIYAGGSNLRQITDAKVSIDANGTINYAEFTSKKGGSYTFYYGGKDYVISANAGDRIVFDPNNNKLTGSSLSEKDMSFNLDEEKTEKGYRIPQRQGSIKAKNFEITLDKEGNIKEMTLSAGGTYYDAGNNVTFSSKDSLFISYTGSNIQNYAGNAVSIASTEDVFVVSSKGAVAIRDGLTKMTYNGLDDNVYATYDRDSASFNVQGGDASISNGKHKIDVKNGLSVNDDNLEFQGDVSEFSVSYSQDGTKKESLKIGYAESENGLEAYATYSKDGIENTVNLGSLGKTDRNLYASRKIAEQGLKAELAKDIEKISSEIESKKQRGEDVSALLEKQNILELSEAQISISKLIDAKDYDKAIAKLESYLSSSPRDPQSEMLAKMSIAELYQAKGENSDAAGVYKSIQQKYPSKAIDATFALAGLDRQIGLYDKAETEYYSVINNPKISDAIKAQAYLGMGSNLLQQNNPQLALAAYTKAVKYDASNDIAIKAKAGLEEGYINAIRSSVSQERDQLGQEIEDYLNKGISTPWRTGIGTSVMALFGYASTNVELINSARSTLTSQDIGLMFADSLYKQGYSLDKISSLTNDQIAKIYNLPIDSTDEAVKRNAIASTVKIKQNIEEAFTNPDLQNLASGARYPFNLGKERYTSSEFTSAIEPSLKNMIMSGPNVVDAALFIPFGTVGGASAFSSVGGEMLIVSGGRFVAGAPGISKALSATSEVASKGKAVLEETKAGQWFFSKAIPTMTQDIPSLTKVEKFLNQDIHPISSLKQVADNLKAKAAVSSLAKENQVVFGSWGGVGAKDVQTMNFPNKEAMLNYIDQGYDKNLVQVLKQDFTAQNQFLLDVNGQQFVAKIEGDFPSVKLLQTAASEDSYTLAKTALSNGPSKLMLNPTKEEIANANSAAIAKMKTLSSPESELADNAALQLEYKSLGMELVGNYVRTDDGKIFKVLGVNGANGPAKFSLILDGGSTRYPLAITDIYTPEELRATIKVSRSELIPKPGAVTVNEPEKINAIMETSPPKFREIQKILVDNVQKISFEEFDAARKTTIVGENGLNEILSDGKHYAVVAGRGGIKKSANWVYELSKDEMAAAPEQVFHITDWEWNSNSYMNELLERGVNRFVVFDDASYSGTELQEEFLKNLNSIFNSKTRQVKDLEVIVVAPYVTKYAEEKMVSYAAKEGIKLKLLKSEYLPEVRDFLTPEQLKTWGENRGTTLTYFEHKVPDALSFDSTIKRLVINGEPTPPYKVDNTAYATSEKLLWEDYKARYRKLSDQ